VDYDSSMWDDHDPDCHGRYEDFEDDSDYAAGFTWSCCEKEGDNEGCKSTKHKADVNIIVFKPVMPQTPAPTAKKRKASEEILRPSFARCENCNWKFDVNDNNKKACVYHPGIFLSSPTHEIDMEFLTSPQARRKSTMKVNIGVIGMRGAMGIWRALSIILVMPVDSFGIVVMERETWRAA
jgi:hypothetical protein